MVNIPHSVFDFADALRMLSESQGDVTEIVTKWDLICDTTIPRTVTVSVNGTTREVDNLAKIRQDLVEGLSLDKPTVSSVTFRGKQSNQGNINADRWSNKGWGDLPWVSVTDAKGWIGSFRNTKNDFHSLCVVDRDSVVDGDSIKMDLLQMPKFAFLCAGHVTFTVSAPSVSYVQQGDLADTQYCTTTTFVNRWLDGNAAPLGVVQLVVNDSVNDLLVVDIPPGKSVCLAMWASAGQNIVNAQEIIPHIH